MKKINEYFNSLFDWETNYGFYMPYIDVLRVVACCMVIVIHTSGIDFYHNDAANAIENSCHYAVPIFVTISGTCLIERDIAPKQLLLKIFIQYLFWSFFYLLFNENKNLPTLTITQIIKIFISSPSYFWYLRMMILLWLMLPFINILYKKIIVLILIRYCICILNFFLIHIESF